MIQYSLPYVIAARGPLYNYNMPSSHSHNRKHYTHRQQCAHQSPVSSSWSGAFAKPMTASSWSPTWISDCNCSSRNPNRWAHEATTICPPRADVSSLIRRQPLGYINCKQTGFRFSINPGKHWMLVYFFIKKTYRWERWIYCSLKVKNIYFSNQRGENVYWILEI